MENNTKNLVDLGLEMETFFNDKPYKVIYPNTGAAMVYINFPNSGENFCQGCRIFCSAMHDGCFNVSLKCRVLPLSEERYINTQHFNRVEDAYNFIIKRANEINNFFIH